MSNTFFQGGRKKFKGASSPCAPLVAGLVFSHAGKLYSEKRVNLAVRIFAILMLDANEKESTFGHHLNLD